MATSPANQQRTPGWITGRMTGWIALAGVLAGCGVDQSVVTVTIEQTPGEQTPGQVLTPVPGTTDPAGQGTTPPTTDVAGESSSGDDGPTSSLPPISEPELLVDIPIEDVVNVGEEKSPRSYDGFVGVALSDIERWWSEVYPSVYGEPFEPLAQGVYAGYPERTSDLPGCGEPRTRYQDLTLYVAFYCGQGDFLIYDDGDDSLLRSLTDEFGPAVMGIVLAHEYGHAIQQRSGVLDQQLATIYTEQQADCFAGAWTGQAYRGESPFLRLGDADVRAGLIAMLSVRDPVGVDQFVAGGHGSAFDRVGAFQEGFVSGPARCGELIDHPLTLMPNQFWSLQDVDRQGNASYDCSDDPNPDCTPAPTFLANDLNDFWTTALGAQHSDLTAEPVANLSAFECTDVVVLASEAALCPSKHVVAYDEPAVLSLYNDFGDFTLGYFYGIAWAEWAQQETNSSLAGEARALMNDCLTGAWVRDITPDGSGNTPRRGDRNGDGVVDSITSSPGDLDEAIRMAVLVGDPGANDNVVGSPFEKIESFRAGVLGGLQACNARLPG